MKNLTHFRYYLEIISVPVFAFLVIHLAGHGLMLIKDPDHHHGSHGHEVHENHEGETEEAHAEDEGEETHSDENDQHEDEDHEEEADHDEAGMVHADDDYDEHNDEHQSPLSLEFLLSTEILGGILALILFIWVWHSPLMKRLVPCSHDHCHHKTIWPHLLATGAFVFHFFPESAVRYELLKDIDWQDLWNIAGVIGFASHFLVDLIIMVLLAIFWPQIWMRILSFVTIFFFWVLAFYIGEQGGFHLPGISEAIMLIASAFLLAMFVHKPHKPKPVCKNCH